MSKALLKKHRSEFTLSDWENAPKVDRLFMYLMQPELFGDEISADEEIYLENLQQIFTLYVTHHDESTVLKLATELIDGVHGRVALVRRYLSDCKSLFGDVIEVNKNFERQIIKEKYLQLAKKAHQVNDYETERKCLDSIVKLLGLDKYPESGIDLPDLSIPQPIYTTDDKVLKLEEAEILENGNS